MKLVFNPSAAEFIVRKANAMTDDEERVANVIRTAFAGVKLGQGVGLRQANGIDDYADKETLACLRSQDEKDDWTAIPSKDLDRYYCSLSYFDAEGMRFHLPAYLISDLSGDLLTADVVYCLVTNFWYGLESQFAILTDAQRSAVEKFLWLRLDDPNREFVHPLIEAALENFWMGHK